MASLKVSLTISNQPSLGINLGKISQLWYDRKTLFQARRLWVLDNRIRSINMFYSEHFCQLYYLALLFFRWEKNAEIILFFISKYSRFCQNLNLSSFFDIFCLQTVISFLSVKLQWKNPQRIWWSPRYLYQYLLLLTYVSGLMSNEKLTVRLLTSIKSMISWTNLFHFMLNAFIFTYFFSFM